jgi:glutathione synthase/RimK-type ligase-like ATP-grasp enzyme
VVKPVIGASAHGTAVVARGDPAASIHLDGGDVLVQPLVDEIRTAGEWSAIFVDGAITHAVLKRPAPGEFRVQARFGGSVEVAAPPPVVQEAAGRAVAALPVEPLYARIDGVVTPEGFLLMEAEVDEPGLFFAEAPAAAEAFAAAIVRRLWPAQTRPRRTSRIALPTSRAPATSPASRSRPRSSSSPTRGSRSA